ARTAGAVIDDEMIQKAQRFDHEWNEATARWTTALKAGLANIMPDLEKMADLAIKIVQGISNFTTYSAIASKMETNEALSYKELATAISLARSKGAPVDPSWIKELERLQELERETSKSRQSTNITVNAASKGP